MADHRFPPLPRWRGQGEGEQGGASPILQEGARGRPSQNGANPKTQRRNPQRYQLSPVPPPESDTSFQTACRAIAAVRKAKHEAKIGLGKPLATLTMSAHDGQLDQLRLVQADVADAGGAPQITYKPVESDDGYVATVEAPN